MLIYLFVALQVLQQSTAFTSSLGHNRPLITSSTPVAAFYNDFEGFGEDSSSSSSSSDSSQETNIYASLRERQSSLDAEKKESLEIWRQAPTKIEALPLSPPPPLQVDWVRRVAVDTSATTQRKDVIVGGSSGSLYLLDLETAQQCQLPEVHESRGEEDDPILLKYMYGKYDGGGIVALARKDNLVVSSGRDGGFHLSVINDKNDKLSALGRINTQSTSTALVLDQSDTLWVGSFEDGMIRAYNTEDVIDEEDDGSVTIGIPLMLEIKAKSGILSLCIEEEIQCGVAATAKDGILLFDLRDGSTLATWNPFEGTSEFARSVAIVQNDGAARIPPVKIPNPEDPSKNAYVHAVASWSVVVGGSEGSLHQRQLSIHPTEGGVNARKPWHKTGVPHAVPTRFCHQAPIVALASPGNGLLLSAGQDGTIRGWDVSYLQTEKINPISGEFEADTWLGGVFGSGSKPSYIFGLSGYKVWLGSLVLLNGNMLVTDGADNCVVSHVFTGTGDAGSDEN